METWIEILEMIWETYSEYIQIDKETGEEYLPEWVYVLLFDCNNTRRNAKGQFSTVLSCRQKTGSGKNAVESKFTNQEWYTLLFNSLKRFL